MFLFANKKDPILILIIADSFVDSVRLSYNSHDEIKPKIFSDSRIYEAPKVS